MQSMQANPLVLAAALFLLPSIFFFARKKFLLRMEKEYRSSYAASPEDLVPDVEQIYRPGDHPDSGKVWYTFRGERVSGHYQRNLYQDLDCLIHSGRKLSYRYFDGRGNELQGEAFTQRLEVYNTQIEKKFRYPTAPYFERRGRFDWPAVPSVDDKK